MLELVIGAETLLAGLLLALAMGAIGTPQLTFVNQMMVRWALIDRRTRVAIASSAT